MNLEEAMQELKTAGSAQSRNSNAEELVFGVLWSVFRKIAKKIKINQPLAESLWRTGDNDAQILALLIADPEKMGLEGLDAWAHQLTNIGQTAALIELVERSPWHRPLADRWSEMPGEWVGATGYGLTSSLAQNNHELDNSYFKRKLKQIEDTVHQRENMCRYMMNSTLIAIGKRNFELWEFARTAYQRTGKINVDHGKSGGKTPDPKVELKVKPPL